MSINFFYIGREAGIRTQMLRLSVVDTNPYMTSLYGGQNKSRTYFFGFSDQRAHRLRYLSIFGALDRNRTGMILLPKDFKSFASTCSATWAFYLVIHWRFELQTPWLKVKCSTNWASESYVWWAGCDSNTRSRSV